MAMANTTSMPGMLNLPPLPSFELKPLPALLPFISDKALAVFAPIAAYWVFSLFFHWIDTKDYFPQYRLHTPAEVLKRNRASRREVVRDVVIQQIIQMAMGYVLTAFEPDEFVGQEDYDVAVWAQRIRLAQQAIPGLFALVGVDAIGLGKNLSSSFPTLAGLVSGGQYPFARTILVGVAGTEANVPSFAKWELALAWAIYNIIVPATQYVIAICVVDTWQYFLHRAMHMNKYLYTSFHSRHHRLYVPYAYGALYNHPVEGFLLDTLGASIAYKLAGMNTRQGLIFFTGSTLKTVDDHCGYALPFDPLQHLTSNNAGYHDVHHQTWGIKSNFSQPFFTFWDSILGTKWTGGDVSARYERSRKAAQQALNQENERAITGSDAAESATYAVKPYQEELSDFKNVKSINSEAPLPPIPHGKADVQAAASRQQVLEDPAAGGKSVLAEEGEEEVQAQKANRRSPRKRALSSKDSFKGLRDRVTGSMHCGSGIMGVNSNR